MTWAKLDDSFPEHPKVIGLSDRAFRVHVTAICFAAKNETDGEIPRAALARLAGTGKAAAELVAAGLWDTTSRGGWAIHDYLKYNPSKLLLDEKRQQTAERVERWRNDRRNAGGNAVTNGVSNAGGNAAPDPSRPVPSAKAEEEAKASLPEKPPKRITDDFRESMRREFPDLDEHSEHEKATNHVAYRKAIDKRLYYRNWLRKAREFNAERGNTNGQSGYGPRTNRQPNVTVAQPAKGPGRVPDLVVDD
jgi:hypothetical protein